jgi:putative membrane protein
MGGRRSRDKAASLPQGTPLPLPLIVPLLSGAGALAAAVVLIFILWR